MFYNGLQATGMSLTLPRMMGEMAESMLSGMPRTPFSRMALANLELFRQNTDAFDPFSKRPQFGFDSVKVEGRPVPIREEVVDRTPFCDLLHFRKEGAEPGNRILIVAPMSGHYATLLRGTVAPLLATHDVYITDWKNARDVPRSAGKFDLDDYTHTLMGHMRRLGPDTTVMAVCQATVPALAATSLLAQSNDPAQPARLVLMGGPLDTAAAPTEVTRFAEAHDIGWFRQNMIHTVPTMPSLHAGAGREVYPGVIQLTAFESMNREKHTQAQRDQWFDRVLGKDEPADRKRDFYREYKAVMDLTGEFYLDTVSRVFQRRDLARGLLDIAGVRVNPAAIRRTSVMAVEGERDDISAVGQTSAALPWLTGLTADRKSSMIVPGVGHYGVFSGRGYEQHVVPAIMKMEAGDGGPSAKAKMAEGIATIRSNLPRRDTVLEGMAAE